MGTKIYILSTMLALNLSACTDIQDGTTDIDSWPAINEYTLNHPCMLHTDADFTYVKSKLTRTPWSEGLDKLKNSGYSYSNYTPEAQEILGRMDDKNWSATFPDWWNNYTYFYEDAAAAYQLALRWKLEGDIACGQAAVRILNEWATTCKGLVRVKSLANDRTYDPNGEIADPNEYLISINVHQMVNAAEIMRTDETLFKKDELAAFQTMVKNVFYPAASDFLAHRESCKQHSWLNWDLAQMTSILSIGILCDDQDMINEAILYFKYGVGNGCIDNAVPFLHQDPDGHGMLGQGQESGRDQGHATLCVSLMGHSAKWHIISVRICLLMMETRCLLWLNIRLNIICGKTLMILLPHQMRNLCIVKKISPIPIMRIVAGSALNFLLRKRMISREVKYVLVGL